MTFSDLNFIIRALPLFLILYYVFPAKVRPWLIILASIGFCAINDYMNVVFLVECTIVNHLFAKLVAKKKKPALVFILIFNAAVLGGFKIAGVLDDGIAFPLGLSFYIFKMISYQVDLYKGVVPEVNFRNVSVYFSMFPQLLSGPISRYSYVEANKTWVKVPKEERAPWKDRFQDVLAAVEDGTKYFVIGLFMKVIIADHLAVLWSDILMIGFESISTPLAWLGVYSYSMNLYFDFWGYSLMAAGLGVMLGFPFIENFIQPYSASSVSDFYRRWHATLGSWFRDYIYIPLGGSKCGTRRTIFNLVVVWIITGLWHGMTFNFILWAMALLLLIVIEKFILSKVPAVYKIIGRINVLILIPCTWMIFAIHEVKGIGIYFTRLFPILNKGLSVNKSDIIFVLPSYWPYLLLGLFFVIPFVQKFYREHKENILVILALFVMFWISITSLANSAGNPFMYLRF
jgi:alginate O-acetyltransferase complex protein AlgI